MKKIFCDKCKVEIEDHNHVRTLARVPVIGMLLIADGTGALPEVTVGLRYAGANVDKDVCKHCVLDAVAAQDDRLTKEN